MNSEEFDRALMTSPFSNRELRLHDAEQRRVIDMLRRGVLAQGRLHDELLTQNKQQAQQIATLREALQDKEDDVRHLMASVMQLVTIVRGSIVTSDVTQSILFKAEHLLKVIGEKQALKEVNL